MPALNAPTPSDQETLRRIAAFVSLLRPERGLERRQSQRIALPFLLRLEAAGSEAITVVGKDISSAGIGFFHQQPLAMRQAKLTLSDPRIGTLSLEVELAWCRFCQLGWYESGGRLRDVQLSPPVAKAG